MSDMIMRACGRCGIKRLTRSGRRNLCQDCYHLEAAKPVARAGDSRWGDRADCQNLNPEFFYPVSDGIERAEVQAVLAICRDCPVVSECLADALATPEKYDHGIRGATTERQRRAMRKARAAAQERAA